MKNWIVDNTLISWEWLKVKRACHKETELLSCVLQHVTSIHKFLSGLCCGYFAPACRHTMLNKCALSSRERGSILLLTPTQLLRLTSAWVICQIRADKNKRSCSRLLRWRLGFHPWIQQLKKQWKLFKLVFRKFWILGQLMCVVQTSICPCICFFYPSSHPSIHPYVYPSINQPTECKSFWIKDEYHRAAEYHRDRVLWKYKCNKLLKIILFKSKIIYFLLHLYWDR